MADDEKHDEGEKPKPPAVKPAPPAVRPAPPAHPAPPAAARPSGADAVPNPDAPAKPSPPEDPMKRPVASVPADLLKEKFPDQIEEIVHFVGEVTVKIKKDLLVEVSRFLKEDPRSQLTLLSDLSAADYPEEKRRFEVNYHLYSIPLNQRLRLKVRVCDGEPVQSVAVVWATANWHEREAFDLFGIRFEGHPDLTRILLPDDWRGHPLRKEYPLEGFADQHPRYR